MSKPRVIERYSKKGIWFHWIHTAAFLVLLITGAILIIPGLGGAAASGATRVIHRVAVVLFVAAPIVYAILDFKSAKHFIKETFTWGKGDIKWVKSAPDYYFGGAEEKMPPQGNVNTGQKLWQLILIATSIIFVITGIVMWFFKGVAPTALFQWCVIFHDIAFVGVLAMLLVHVYLGAIHPRMKESWLSMLDGKISVSYAIKHYGLWYKEIAGKTQNQEDTGTNTS